MRANAVTAIVVLSVLAYSGFRPQAEKPAEQTAALATKGSADQQPSPRAQTPAPIWPVSFADTAMPPTRVSDPNRLTLTLLLANTSADAQSVTIAVPLRSSSGALLATDVTCTANGTAAVAAQSSCQMELPAKTPIIPVTIGVATKATQREAYPLNGVVIVGPVGDNVWSVPLPRATLALNGIGLDSAAAQDWNIVAGSAGIAAVVVAVGFLICVLIWDRWIWLRRMGGATFSFTDSWSNALMIGGPLVTAFLTSFSAFPDYGHTMSKRSYLLLSLLLSALIALGPAIFNLIKLPTRIEHLDGATTTESQGLVVFFFLAAMAALTGGFGQLWLLEYVLADLTSAGFLSASLGTTLVSASVWLFRLVVVASVISLVTTVAAATARDEPPAEDAQRRSVGELLQDAVNATPARRRGTPLPTWSPP